MRSSLGERGLARAGPWRGRIAVSLNPEWIARPTFPMTRAVRHSVFFSWLAGVFGDGAAAETLTVGPFTIEAVERKISAGGRFAC